MEYSALGDTLAGLLPRMRSGGRLFALMHHHDSVVAKMSARAVSEYDEADIAAIKKALTTIHETLIKTGSVAALKADEEAEAARKFMNGMGNKYVRGATMETGNAFMADHVLGRIAVLQTDWAANRDESAVHRRTGGGSRRGKSTASTDALGGENGRGDGRAR